MMNAEKAAYLRAHRSDLRAVPYAELQRAWSTLVEEDLAQMIPYLPDTAASILDVGCGLGLHAAVLAEWYPQAQVYLLDGDGPPEGLNGWSETAPCPSTSRALTELVFESASRATPPIWLDPNSDVQMEADLVISLLAWGFHFPLATYPGIRGRTTILDIRCDPQYPVREVDAAVQRFGPGEVVLAHPKFLRTCWRPPA